MKKSRNGKHEELPDTIAGYPVPKALFAAIDRDPDAALDLLTAVDRLISSSQRSDQFAHQRLEDTFRDPLLDCPCPHCHPCLPLI